MKESWTEAIFTDPGAHGRQIGQDEGIEEHHSPRLREVVDFQSPGITGLYGRGEPYRLPDDRDSSP
jgi:hypothetical protein